jgi:segregation and condensation protein B
MSDPQHLRLVEALLFASAKPIDEEGLAARLPKDVDVPTVLTDLAAIYAERGVNLVRRGEGWVFRTAPDLGAILAKETIVPRKLPRAAVETLAIVAYHQPVTRAEIEDIRGVSVSQGTLDILFEAGWVAPQGRKEAPGRPMLWATTPVFLDHFGLKSLEDLPGLEELKASGLLDANPALPTYAASAHGEGELGADEAPVEPLGDDEPAATHEVAVQDIETQGIEAQQDGEGDDEPLAHDQEREDDIEAEAAADAADAPLDEPADEPEEGSEGVELAEGEDGTGEAEDHGAANGDDGANGSNGSNGGNGTNGGNGSNGGMHAHALAEEEDLERSALADAMLNTAEAEAAPHGAEEN